MSQLPRILVSGGQGEMDNYIHAVTCAGGRPVPGCCPPPDLSCAGLLLCGGGDPDPALFGQENRGSHPPDRPRDRAELALIQAFLAAGRPILGVCRGMQLLNIALGGDLIQDLGEGVRPFHREESGDLYHPVLARQGSLLHRLYGPHFFVNSFHHQAVGAVAADLVPTVWAEGGFAEGVEHRALPVVGVQFHPERLAWEKRKPGAIDGALLLNWFMDRCRAQDAG